MMGRIQFSKFTKLILSLSMIIAISFLSGCKPTTSHKANATLTSTSAPTPTPTSTPTVSSGIDGQWIASTYGGCVVPGSPLIIGSDTVSSYFFILDFSISNLIYEYYIYAYTSANCTGAYKYLGLDGNGNPNLVSATKITLGSLPIQLMSVTNLPASDYILAIGDGNSGFNYFLIAPTIATNGHTMYGFQMIGSSFTAVTWADILAINGVPAYLADPATGMLIISKIEDASVLPTPTPTPTLPPVATGNTPTQIASGITPTSVVTDGTNVYWSESLLWNSPTSNVGKVSVNGGAVTVLAANVDPTFSLAVNSNNVFWMDNGSSYFVPIAGGAVTTLQYGYSTPIVADATSIYYVIDDELRNVTTANVLTTLATTGNAVGAMPYAISIVGSNLYWVDNSDNLKTISTSGGAVTTIGTSYTDVNVMTADSTNVYWGNSNGVYKVPVGGGTTTTMSSLANPICMAIDANYLYWADATHIGKIALSDSSVTMLAEGRALSTATNGDMNSNCLTVDSNNVYWTETSGIYKVPK